MAASAKTLIVRLSLLALAVLGTAALISQYDIRSTDNSYIAAVLEKDRLIRDTPSPKIILVGGSNLAFGIDSHMLEDSLGIHVVNMGLYAKLGLRYMLAQVKPYIRKGDLVLVVPEYDQFFGEYANGDNTLNTALLYAPTDRLPDFIKSYSVVDVILRPRAENVRRAALQGFADALGQKDKFFPPDTNPVYSRRSFNDRGDMVSHLGRKGKDPDSIFARGLPPMKEFNKRTVDDLNSIVETADRVGARSYFLYPSYMERAYRMGDASIDSLRALIARRSRMPMVGKPADFVYPDSLFFDTRYHLNQEGRRIRSIEMIHTIRPLISRAPPR
jgi:hypothetical protein